MIIQCGHSAWMWFPILCAAACQLTERSEPAQVVPCGSSNRSTAKMFHWLHRPRAICVQLCITSSSGTFSLYQSPLPGTSSGVSRPATKVTMMLCFAAARATRTSDSTYRFPASNGSTLASKCNTGLLSRTAW